jgi:hypothetical protein
MNTHLPAPTQYRFMPAANLSLKLAGHRITQQRNEECFRSAQKGAIQHDEISLAICWDALFAGAGN